MPVRYVPLSQFFLMSTEKGDGEEAALYGRQEPQKKRKGNGKGKGPPAPQTAALPQGAAYAPPAKTEEGPPGVYKAGPGGPSAGFTGSGNIPQVAVPIGPKRKRRGNLLRRVVPLL